MKTEALIRLLKTGGMDDRLRTLYGGGEETLARQRARYADLIHRYCEWFPGREEIALFSAPGRTEIGGNHTDHQRGCCLGAAVDLDIIAAVSFRDEGVIRLKSAGHDMGEVALSDLSARDSERDKSVSMIRGIAARFAQRGVTVGGFDAYTLSDVTSGSGLSSSAAFETLVGTIIDTQYNGGKTDPAEIAKIGQYAENVYYGKGSGLLDQTVSSVGGLVFLDFRDPARPIVKQQQFDFESAGYHLCVTDTKSRHNKLDDDYASIPNEMKTVAAQFGKDVLRETDEDAFYAAIPDLHGKCSDRAILRAIHFFGENRRAAEEAQALENGDIDAFFRLYRQSARSSESLLQNLYSVKRPTSQGIPLALAVSRLILGEDAAVRVHGGGFAGTIQAFVPIGKTQEYRRQMDALFGAGSCNVLRLRAVGGIKVI